MTSCQFQGKIIMIFEGMVPSETYVKAIITTGLTVNCLSQQISRIVCTEIENFDHSVCMAVLVCRAA